jgi:hypothetical protein
MRPQTDRAQAAILRAVAAIAAPFGARVVIEELRARDWASLTLTGTRHELDVRLDGVGAAAALAALGERLAHESISIAGQILAEAVVEPGTADDEGVAMTVCALVINDRTKRAIACRASIRGECWLTAGSPPATNLSAAQKHLPARADVGKM